MLIGLITSQDVTTPKLTHTSKTGISCLITSQDVTTPKHNGGAALDYDSLITSQDVTTPKQRVNPQGGGVMFNYQSGRHYTKTEAGKIADMCSFNYQSGRHYTKT